MIESCDFLSDHPEHLNGFLMMNICMLSISDNHSPVVTISIEVELGWGRHFLENPNYGSIISDDRAIETSKLQSLLELCDDLEIPITFDVVGHLLLDNCDGEHKGPYDPEWFSSDPETSIDDDPLFYAPDLIKMINSSSTRHEIATHTFSHVLFDQVEEDIADHEFQLVKDVYDNFGLPTPSSLVAPLHKRPPFQVLQLHDIETIRSPDRNIERGNWPVQSLNVVQRPNVIRNPKLKNGVLHSYCTPWPSLTSAMLPTGQRQVDPPLNWIPITIRKYLHKKKLHRALQNTINKQSHLHLWTHLYNMANEPQWDVIRGFLQTLANHKQETALQICPMKNLKQHYL